MQELANAAPGALHLDEHRDSAAAILHNDGLRSERKRTNRAALGAVRNDALCNLAAGEEAGAQPPRLSWQEDGARAQRVRTIARQDAERVRSRMTPQRSRPGTADAAGAWRAARSDKGGND